MFNLKFIIMVCNVPVKKNDDGSQVVNARDLHKWLNIGKDFTTWIKSRIDKYNFIENEDFIVFTKIGENPQGGRPSSEYIISLDMAKELSMVENNERGREARKCFIEVEKLARKAYASCQVDSTKEWIEKEKARLLLGVEWVKECSNVISMNEVSKLQLLNKVKDEAGELGRFLPLPEYAKTSGVSKSATELLKRYRPGLNIRDFNKILVEKGALIVLERKSKSSPTGMKFFKAISNDWLNYGENLANPHSPNDRQPMWFVDKFEDLLNKLG